MGRGVTIKFGRKMRSWPRSEKHGWFSMYVFHRNRFVLYSILIFWFTVGAYSISCLKTINRSNHGTVVKNHNFLCVCKIQLYQQQRYERIKWLFIFRNHDFIKTSFYSFILLNIFFLLAFSYNVFSNRWKENRLPRVSTNKWSASENDSKKWPTVPPDWSKDIK